MRELDRFRNIQSTQLRFYGFGSFLNCKEIVKVVTAFETKSLYL
jgi:hypothetical protein